MAPQKGGGDIFESLWYFPWKYGHFTHTQNFSLAPFMFTCRDSDMKLQFHCTFRHSVRDLQDLVPILAWLIVLIQILAWLPVKNTVFYKLNVAARLPHWLPYICVSYTYVLSASLGVPHSDCVQVSAGWSAAGAHCKPLWPIVSSPPRARLPARNGLVSKLKFLGLIPQNGGRPMRLWDR